MIAIGIPYMAINSTPNASIQIEGAHAVEFHHTIPKGGNAEAQNMDVVQNQALNINLKKHFPSQQKTDPLNSFDKLMMRL